MLNFTSLWPHHATSSHSRCSAIFCLVRLCESLFQNKGSPGHQSNCACSDLVLKSISCLLSLPFHGVRALHSSLWNCALLLAFCYAVTDDIVWFWKGSRCSTLSSQDSETLTAPNNHGRLFNDSSYGTSGLGQLCRTFPTADLPTWYYYQKSSTSFWWLYDCTIVWHSRQSPFRSKPIS